MKNSLKVVICALNSKYIHSALAPWYLKADVETHCAKTISVTIIERTINEDLYMTARLISDQRPDVVGLSCYIWNIESMKKLISILDGMLPNAAIVLGGPEVSYIPSDILRNEPLVDFVISGEGERPFSLLLNAISEHRETWNIPGISCRRAGQPYICPPQAETKDPPNPYTDEYFDALNGRIAYLETSRGCPYTCAFCLSGFGRVRFFDINRAKKHILLLANSGAHTVKLVDRTFNANRKRAYELLDFIIEHYETSIPKNVRFHFEIAGDLLAEDTLNLLSRAPAGLIQMEIGLQSFNRTTLSGVNRKTDIELLKDNIERLAAMGNIHIHIDLIAGLPYEDLNSFAHSFNTAYMLKPHMLQLGFLKLLHGSSMRENAINYPCIFDRRAPYEVIETPYLSRYEFELLHQTEDALARLYNSGRFLWTLEFLLEQSKKSPFDLLSDFGKYCANKDIKGISLNSYTAIVYEYFSLMECIDKTRLRDTMAADLLSVNPSGRLPPIMQIKDPAFKHIKSKLRNIYPQNATNLGIAILYSENAVAFCDYSVKNPVTGRYPLQKVKICSDFSK